MHKKLQLQFDKIERQRVQIIESLDNIAPAILDTAPAPGKWTVLQNIQHLILIEQASISYIQKKLHYRSNIPKANWKTAIRSWSINWVLDIPLKIKSPKAFSNFPDQLNFQQVLKEWEETRIALRQLLEDFPEDLLNSGIYKHALLGKLRMIDALVFIYEHTKRHFKQIQRTLKEIDLMENVST